MVIRLPADSRRLRLLRVPLLRTSDRARVERSWWLWGAGEDGTYVLTPLAVLHHLTGLTVEVRPRR